MDQSRRARVWMRWAIGALIVLRLMFIARDEIRPFPYDEAAYIMQAKARYWGNTFNSWTFTRQPGFPLFIAGSARLGLPLRLAFELMWVTAALVLLRACVRAGVRPGGRLLLLALLLFHPFATQLFCRALADNLYTAMWLVFTVAMACAISSDERRALRRWGLLAAGAGAIAANTRQETVLVYALGALAAAWVLAGAARERWRASPIGIVTMWRRRFLAGVLLPMVVTFASVQCVNLANWRHFGAYVGYDWSLPGFKELYRTLLAIPPEVPRLRVPIPADVRAKAAAASPTFARLLPIIENGERCAPYRRDGERITGIAGEPGSFNLQCIHDAIWELHQDRIASAAEFDRFCWQVVAELRAAAERGQIVLRSAPLSFVPPEWGQLLLAVPRALPVCWDRMTRIGFDRLQLFPVGPDEERGFDQMALRRSALVAHQHRGPLPASIQRSDAIKGAVGGCWPWVSWVLLVAWLGGWLAALWAWRRMPRGPINSCWWALATLITGSLMLRVLLVATLDACGVEASDRYMFPAAALLVPAGVLGLRAIVAVATARRPISSTPTGTTPPSA